ncbi:hypothetical protein [Flavobacterium phycosphaerae]|uniref:hypothetical protein n=1 Tax=Flavobacterium phycosphaerae TaxID=2697515 RepID=UPI00138A5B42|nr:hypothetical protein [Flavobacterium phycosphaerae]
MKKFLFLLFTTLVITSCSNDTSNEVIPTPTPSNGKLQRVDFLPGNPNERRWLFNTEGLLSAITKADGTLLETFAYDLNNELIQNVKYNGTNATTYNISYESGFIAEINGENYNYSYVDHKYSFSSGFTSLECKLGSNDFLKEAHSIYDDDVDFYEDQYFCGYDANGNLIHLFFHGPFIGDPENTYSYDENHINPIREGISSIAKAKSIYDPWFLKDGNSSVNIMTTMHYAAEDPESAVYTYEFNSDNLPISQTKNNYYSGVFENSYVAVKYYYQGDVIP